MFATWLVCGALVLVTIVIFRFYKKRADFVSKVDVIPGYPGLPFLGNVFDLWKPHPHDIFQSLCDQVIRFGPTFRYWIFNRPMVVLHRARDLEKVLQNMTHHAKSPNYELFKEWMGQGLLTSRDEKWRSHRKVLTPAFHFNILHEFMPIFNKHAHQLTEQLSNTPGKTSHQGLNIFHFSSLCSLDIICESAMGTKIDAQSNENSPYVKAIIRMNEFVTMRYFTPWLRPDFLFNLTPKRKEYDQVLKTINDFTDKVIAERRNYLKSNGFSNITNSSENIGGRRRLAFLDVLLAAESEGAEFMTQKDIRDQVSTFMFEGHDTVSTATCWALFMIGTYPQIQDRIVAELDEVFGESGRSADLTDLGKLKYLEQVIKETLRLYPSVPFFERSIEEDAKLEHYTIPAGCGMLVNTYVLHRDHEFWPDPEKFDPERFSPENCQGRNPYAYIPFSAGPRNCIGQKFAQLEEKCVVSTVLRRFRVEAAHSREDAILEVGMVLRPQNGLSVRFFERTSHPKLRVSDI